MPLAQSNFYTTTAKINSILAGLDYLPSSITIPKKITDTFKAGQLIAFDATNNVAAEFTATPDGSGGWDYNTPFCGFAEYDRGNDTDDIVVYIGGDLKVSELLFGKVRLNDLSAVANYTLDDLLTVPSVDGQKLNPYKYQGQEVLRLIVAGEGA